MDSLTESEIAQITRLQRDAGVQRLSCHFSWPEFSDERRSFHQEFVYDFAAFAADRGFSWPDVIQAAAIAKDVFPQLHDLDVPNLLFLLRDVLCERLQNLTPVHQHDFARHFVENCLARRRLFQAVVGGAADTSIVQLQLEVQVPPVPCPLEQGMDLHEWEALQDRARVTSTLQQKEQELRRLRERTQVTLGDVNIPEECRDKQRIVELVQAAVRAAEGHLQESLQDEATLMSDVLFLKVQLAALTTGGQHSTASSTTGDDSQPSEKVTSGKAKTGVKESGRH
ncbi:uncharacterized protein C8orf74 homolog [Mugil cephalus]|uniref:uncharacterized protein C8orf74 homolog n=1 Tax=Mugil cephalus TaxID=48193 RepID=UPI001FB7EA41|nr:uncharacterized protein C8orf74 homolog [Mugil cephalus]XP_047432349.1 uncharacterized protein C8orf74 homolog [Mugil cephalus]XP_047432350.1 uncharacterized protein C8orf74 homolog [Mugil cephalus]XP_047432351.1 uncharacterized protein C8orf74 homolog [Mugil cephalus]XP_047432352.1 uncharacterized protein C8orf74 homolog [Mugil cephalus]